MTLSNTHSALIDATRQKDSLTENGALTNSTSLSNCLDLFFLAGSSRKKALRGQLDSMIPLFNSALIEDPTLTYKILFWARDCRLGAGERAFFQFFAKYIKDNHPHDWMKIYTLIPFYGYWKDFFVIEEPTDRTISFLGKKLVSLDQEDHPNLLAKWYPRKGKWFSTMHKSLKLSPKAFRKFLVDNTKVVESKMCKNEWGTIDYSTVPSIAMNKYRNVFGKRDEERFSRFNDHVLAGEEKVNSSVIYPYQLFEAAKNGADSKSVEAQWKCLPDFMSNSSERIIPVCDVSGSMQGLPMAVSVSLGLYISERNKSIFKDAFITFSGNPTMNYLKGTGLIERMIQLETAEWGMNTDLDKVFQLILDSAVEGNVSEDEMPTKILIISDMEFDGCCYATGGDLIKMRYENSGYKLPGIIFWNVNGRLGNIPASNKDENVGLISGFSPSILTSVLSGEDFNPYSLMLKVLNSDRYNSITKCLNS